MHSKARTWVIIGVPAIVVTALAILLFLFLSRFDVVVEVEERLGPISVSPIHRAMINDEPLEEIEKIIGQNQSQINSISEHWGTPLHLASINVRPDLVDLLLRNGADPNVATTYEGRENFTPLHIAAVSNNVEIAQLLLDAGASTSIQTGEGLTAADLAARYKKREVAQLLETQERDAEIETNGGNSQQD